MQYAVGLECILTLLQRAPVQCCNGLGPAQLPVLGSVEASHACGSRGEKGPIYRADDGTLDHGTLAHRVATALSRRLEAPCDTLRLCTAQSLVRARLLAMCMSLHVHAHLVVCPCDTLCLCTAQILVRARLLAMFMLLHGHAYLMGCPWQRTRRRTRLIQSSHGGGPGCGPAHGRRSMHAWPYPVEQGACRALGLVWFR